VVSVKQQNVMRIETELGRDDLVLPPGTRRRIEGIETWIQRKDKLETELKPRPGHRTLFYGPPGTGKTLTACLLGKSTGRDVYRVDLSPVVTKYIGETEKNLAKVFDHAQRKGWILFFDEADALFGKRSEINDAHDRYANQEISYLLQRLETFDGVAILSSNHKNIIDDAFARRFESVIHFPIPRPAERLKLWKRGLPAKAKLEKSIDLESLARTYNLSGGAIMDILRYASQEALKNSNETIAAEDVMQGIRRER
jgi:SpoVK/Ycf46/Vps4 family AAA+-type ATPase